MLARHVSEHCSTDVIVFDSNPETRLRAAREGFTTVDNLSDLSNGKDAVVLGACQAQLSQAEMVPAERAVFFQQAAQIFNAPHHGHFAPDFRTSIQSRLDALYELYLATDPRSRHRLLDVLSFRLSLDPNDLKLSRLPAEDMWFDIPLRFASRGYETFLDVGAYDGDTLRLARERLEVSRGIAVEANPSLHGSIREAGLHYPEGIKLVNHAAWSHACRLESRDVGGGMISVREADSGDIEARALDETVSEKVDFLKMDIEGSELPALEGCQSLLAFRPDLAIAAYHRPTDLLQIPEFLKKSGVFNAQCSLHVGHYSDVLDDTILYFLQTR